MTHNQASSVNLHGVQVVGGCWYVLAIQRVAACLTQQCSRTGNCGMSLSCSKGICYEFLKQPDAIARCGVNSTITHTSFCLDDNGPFSYGIYSSAVPVISSNAIVIKILYPISWGLFQLRYITFRKNRNIAVFQSQLSCIAVVDYLACTNTVDLRYTENGK